MLGIILICIVGLLVWIAIIGLLILVLCDDVECLGCVLTHHTGIAGMIMYPDCKHCTKRPVDGSD